MSSSRSLPAARLLLLVNYRPEYRRPWGTRTSDTRSGSTPCRVRPPRNFGVLTAGKAPEAAMAEAQKALEALAARV
jgi:hypothetical protein